MTNDNNIILHSDSYKLSHYKQYQPGTTKVRSYFESRIGALYPETVFFGLQYFLRKYLQGRVVTPDKIAAAESIARIHLGGGQGTFNRAGWEHIEKKYNGFLPVEIRAVPEGTRVPTSNVLMTIENTDDECYWLTNYLETLLVQVWYPSTVATVSNYVYQKIRENLDATGDPSGLPFKFHDFGFRGASCPEAAGIGGLAHLVNFSGTNTLAALTTGINYYDSGICGFSIPSSEHSTITSWGKDHELDAFRNMLDQYPEGLVACVSDSYDIGHACSQLWGTDLKQKILDRKGTLIVRPDSGDIVATVIFCLNKLGAKFGTYLNAKGFRCLNDHVRLIQGDGCMPQTISLLLEALKAKTWSGDNITFGMGGGLLQRLNRDTQVFAFKCCSTTVDGVDHDVWKDPVGAPEKASKRGILKLVYNDAGALTTVAQDAPGEDVMRTVFRNGEITQLDTFDEIRKRAQSSSLVLT